MRLDRCLVELVDLVPVLPGQCLVLHRSEHYSIEIQNTFHGRLHAIVSKAVEMLELVDSGCVHGRWIHFGQNLASHSSSKTDMERKHSPRQKK